MPSEFVPQPGLVQIRPQYNRVDTESIFGQPENVLWWQGANLAAFPLDPTQLAAVANAFDGHWSTLWKQVGNGGYQYTGSILTDWSTVTGLEFTSVGVFTPVPGLGSVNHAASTSVLTSLQSAGSPKYRGGHGRVYLPLIGAQMDDEYNFQASAITAVQDQWVQVDDSMAAAGSANGGPYSQFIYRFRGDPTKAHIYGVTHRVVQQKAATQRRRLRKAAHT